MSRQVTCRYQTSGSQERQHFQVFIASCRIEASVDFRDDVVSRSRIGRTFIRVYTDHEEQANVGIATVLMVLFFTLLVMAGVRGTPTLTGSSGWNSGVPAPSFSL